MTSSATNIHGLAVFLIKSTANRFITVARSGNTGNLSQESSKRYLQNSNFYDFVIDIQNRPMFTVNELRTIKSTKVARD